MYLSRFYVILCILFEHVCKNVDSTRCDDLSKELRTHQVIIGLGGPRYTDGLETNSGIC